ncbi:DUF3089 domain-containing protein [Henriciella litoralis]|uniref:DUF3089 domain-containing protein n=1 Tax=Henriciella litoralis TaxID=568102 RepID=UPI0009FFDFEE|nr:DUF3089 domain-containing protein [Henriciella litoralis]
MRRILIAVFVVIVAWIALKDVGYSAFLGRSDTDAITPDYSYNETWFERPAETPEGGWATPWGVDVFVLAPPTTTPAPKGLIPAESDAQKADYDAFAEGAGLQPESAIVYAPAYRAPSPASSAKARVEGLKTSASDVSDAMRRYLAANNRQRGLMILAAPDTVTLLEAALKELPDDEAFRNRFAGVLLPEGVDATEWTDKVGACSPAFDACAVATTLSASKTKTRFFMPTLAHPPLSYSAEAPLGGVVDERAETLSAWLDDNAVKPAEPFDSWAADEVVDVAPIRRPNSETDISGERGN